jgi:hypothetical protein
MGTTFGYGRGGTRYRYYVSRSDASTLGSGGEEIIRRVAAAGLERLILDRVTRLISPHDPLEWERVREIVRRVQIQSRSVVIDFAAPAIVESHERPGSAITRLESRVVPDRLVAEGEDTLTLICERRAVFHGGARADDTPKPDAKQDPRLIPMLKEAHRLLEAHSMSPMNERGHSQAVAADYQRVRRTMALGLLAPRVQRAILEGRIRMSAEQLVGAELPLAWADQRHALR